MAILNVLVALLLFGLLARVSAGLALAAMVFRLIQAALISAGLVALAAVPGAALGGEAAMVRVLIDLHAIGYDVGLVFFAVNSALMAVLLWHSGAVPRLIVTGLGASGVVYLTGSLLRLAELDAFDYFAPAYLVPLFAETAFCLWLIVRARI